MSNLKMSQFLDISLPEYVGSDENIEETSVGAVCICCLSEENVFINLLSCKHSAFLECFFKYKMECPNNYVCIQCHTMLQKIDRFKQQVEECIQILNDQIPLKPKTHNLQISKTVVTSMDSVNEGQNEVDKVRYEIETEVKVEHHNYCDDIDEPLAEVKQQVKKRKKKIPHKPKTQNFPTPKTVSTSLYNINDGKAEVDEVPYEMATEVKVEHDYSDDLDMPLAEMKKRKKKLVRKEKPPKKRSIAQTIEQKYAGKLRTVTLTEEEMLHERGELRREEKYLRLPYKCETCIVGFEFEMAWNSHVLKQHNKTGFTCDLCKSVLSSASSLREHCRRHLRRYECTICKKRYRDEYSAVQHFNELHSMAGAIMVEFQCPLCEFTTRSHRSLRYHRSKHKQEKDKCNLCGNEFTNKSSLNIHMYTLHKQSSRVYKCEPCGKVYRGKSGLFTHMSTVHDAADRRAYCLQCRTYYRTAHNLAHHLRTHSSHITEAEKRFGCDECGSRFITKSTLKSHIEWEHLQIRNNRCTKCSKVFRSSTTLKKHVEFVHEKKRPPRNKICDYCGQGFTTAAILRSHIRTHTGERPHRCTHCSATFAHSSALYNHNRLLHNPDRDRRH